MKSVPSVMSADLEDYLWYGRSRLPGHRPDVTTCPCLDCRKLRGVRDGLLAVFEAIRFIFHLRWWHWIAGERRKPWPAINEADPEKLEKEKYNG